jgi:hypothetical protein
MPTFKKIPSEDKKEMSTASTKKREVMSQKSEEKKKSRKSDEITSEIKKSEKGRNKEEETEKKMSEKMQSEEKTMDNEVEFDIMSKKASNPSVTPGAFTLTCAGDHLEVAKQASQLLSSIFTFANHALEGENKVLKEVKSRSENLKKKIKSTAQPSLGTAGNKVLEEVKSRSDNLKKIKSTAKLSLGTLTDVTKMLAVAYTDVGKELATAESR